MKALKYFYACEWYGERNKYENWIPLATVFRFDKVVKRNAWVDEADVTERDRMTRKQVLSEFGNDFFDKTEWGEVVSNIEVLYEYAIWE